MGYNESRIYICAGGGIDLQKKVCRSIKDFFRFNSTFFATFTVVLVLFSLLLGAFMFYTLYAENKSLSQNAEVSQLNVLKTTSTAVELTLQDLQLLMNQTIWSKEFTSAIINSSSENYSRTSYIVTQLAQIAKDYPYIKRAYLYIPTAHSVYSSDLSYLSANDSFDPLFQDPESIIEFSSTRLSGSTDSLCIKQIDGRPLLFQHLYPDYLNSIGVLIFEFDISALGLLVAQAGEEQPDLCYVFDPTGRQIFTSQAPEDILQQAQDIPGGAEGVLEGPDGSLYFYSRSAQTDWLYMTRTGPEAFQFLPSFRRVLTMGLLMLLLGLFISFQIAFRANRPIRSLLGMLAESNADIHDAENEIDYLAKTYNSTSEQNSHLRQAIANITPMVLEPLFISILAGKAPSGAEIQSTLDSLGNPISPNAKYLAVVIDITERNGSRLQALEANLILLQIRDILHQRLPGDYHGFLISKDDQFLSLILVIPPEDGEVSINQAVLRLCRALDKLSAAAFCDIQWSCGKIYTYIKDVRYSYLDARKSLDRRRFYGQQENEEFSIPLQASYFEQAKLIFHSMRDKQPQMARTLASELTKTIAAEYPESAACLSQYEIYVDTLLEIAGAMNVSSTEELSVRKEAFLRTLRQSGGVPQMSQAVSDFCGEILDIFERRNYKKAAQHISRIQEYIHANYSNCNLSQNIVAEEIGISPAYLSRLFKQEMGTSFTEYINNVRLEQAKQLLISSQLLIKDIAYQTGFNSLQNFFRIFKKNIGISPGEYRREHMNQ